MPKKFVCGNWKMYKTASETAQLLGEILGGWRGDFGTVDVAICPPFTALGIARDALGGTSITYGAQNCYYVKEGAFTGEISPQMLSTEGCEYVILGHSERRTIFGEDDALIAKKTRAVIDAKMTAIVCIGETESERDRDETVGVIERQIRDSLALLAEKDLGRLVVAYEPIWAIGSGKTATPDQVESAHAFIRRELIERFGSEAESVRVIYGGSVKPDNAREIFQQPNIDGGLIGGASLKVESFIAIVGAAV
jgi:triosephosphate isomerase